MRGRGAVVFTGALAVAACVGACGSAATSTTASGSTASGSTAGAPTTAAPTTAATSTSSGGSAGGCTGGSGGGATGGARVTLSEPDAGHTVCVSRGQLVAVRLKGDPARAWTVDVEGTALVAAADGRASLPRGIQGASYRASRPGTARISATRAVCPSPKPGEMACMAVAQSWSVAVLVR